MFSELEKNWMDEHSNLVESKDYDKLWRESEKISKNFASRLFLGLFYLNSPNKFIIRVDHSGLNDKDPRLYFFHPDYRYLNFIYSRISNSDRYESVYKELAGVAQNKIFRLLVEGGTPEEIAKDLIVNKCELQVVKWV